ncbi:related to BCS1 protein precursor [Rhynchosporium agropyri]|uniref:Related to BCS1 protein n=1 Tax=Rhynchosporium agropyri TaxID=914238 RepID=A0A1E1K617_9HELO|nr:related to BCS1 protein precursor [Rhynchosporium agropyri]
MNQMSKPQLSPILGQKATELHDEMQLNPQTVLLDYIFPGFSLYTSAISKFLDIDISSYFPVIVALGVVIYCLRYISQWVRGLASQYFMSTADIRADDELYNILMRWIAQEQFSKQSRLFIANMDLNSRMWNIWRSFDMDGEEDGEDGVQFDEDDNASSPVTKAKEKKIHYTPTFGSHYFWYKGRLLVFRRTETTKSTSWGTTSEMEEIRVSSYGRNPNIIKELLEECRQEFAKNDINQTIIYRGGLKPGKAEPAWTRCLSRISRPFSTVVLDEQVKSSLLRDMRDYLRPNNQRWYANRGIPYRRGYLLYGPPGTGKSSLSFAIAGYFKLAIYIVSLNAQAMSEETLGELFAELPKQCVVLLEDIDTAGLTHSREEKSQYAEPIIPRIPGSTAVAPPAPNTSRISLSGLLNILDGVASQEGRVLIMTTNHKEKLDEALIRPGRVDMSIEFSLANTQMMTTIFRSIFTALEADKAPVRCQPKSEPIPAPAVAKLLAGEKAAEAAAALVLEKIEVEKIKKLGDEFAALIPTLDFSPAEIQGYLLKYKRDPEGAVENATAWVEKMKVEKSKKATEDKLEEDKAKAEAEAEKKMLERWNLMHWWA